MTEINHNTLTLNGVEYVRKDSISQGSPVIGDVRIIIADRGWVFVGNCQDHADGSVTITNCRNIRKWGTSAGLGELVNGPLSGTVADKYGTVRTLPIATIAVVKGW
jgi:hypothetical protein